MPGLRENLMPGKMCLTGQTRVPLFANTIIYQPINLPHLHRTEYRMDPFQFNNGAVYSTKVLSGLERVVCISGKLWNKRLFCF